MAKIKTKEVKVEKKKPSFMEVLTGIWMVAMIAVYPLFTVEKYAYLLEGKYGFMLTAGGVLLGGFIIWALIAKRPKAYAAYMKSFADPATGKWFSGWFKDAFNTWDIFMLALFVIVIISTLCASPYIYQAVFGNEGRWVGTITMVMWCLTFFVASRYFRYQRWYLDVLLIIALIVCIWSITDYFDMDIMGFKAGMDIKHYTMFTSSIGNVDSYAGYASIPMALSGVLFIIQKEGTWRKIFYWICFFIAVLSMVLCGADNAYLAIAVLLGFIPLAATKTKAGVRRCVIAYATFFSAIAIAGHWSVKYGSIVVQIEDAMVRRIGTMDAIKWIAIALWIVAIALFVYEVIIMKYTEDTPAPKALNIIWIVIIAIFAIGLVVLLIIANSNPTALPGSLDGIKKYLILADDWGTWRMYVWKKLMEIYGNLPFINKVFGTGPDTAGIYLHNNYYYDIAMVTGQMFDSVHNECLQMFFTLGPLGLIAYLCVFISPVVMSFRRCLKKYFPVVLGVGFVCICHLGVNFVSVLCPIDTAIVFALMALAQSLFRSKE